MGAAHRRQGGSLLCPKDENEMGQLSRGLQKHPDQHGAGEKASAMSRVHRRPRNGSPAGAHSQQPLHKLNGSVHAAMAFLPC